ncbi:MAG: hypothetical protein Q7U75_09720, partial [Desulfobacterales bacterium]|nr:hypothetical protein [Desulfobacterales bacterium]
MTAPISRTATLLDERQRLAKPEEYVRQVLSNMVPLQRKHDGVIVRIGITGTGAFPNYRIDLPSDP